MEIFDGTYLDWLEPCAVLVLHTTGTVIRPQLRSTGTVWDTLHAVHYADRLRGRPAPAAAS